MNKKAFTLVELIVVITILAILGTIAFISFQGYTKSARDSVRINDLKLIEKNLSLYKVQTGEYPLPSEPYDEVTYESKEVWTQGTIGQSVITNLDKLNKVPRDPLTGNEYTYSRLNTKKELQLACILEGSPVTIIKNEEIRNKNYIDSIFAFNSSYFVPEVNAADVKTIATAYVIGDYNGQIAKVNSGSTTYILAVPTIINGDMSLTDIIEVISNKKLVYNGYGNLPSSYSGTIFEMDGGFDYSETGAIVVYSGSIDDLKTDEDARVTLISNLQSVYSGTILENTGNIKQLVETSIDTNNPSDDAKILAAGTIDNSIGTSIINGIQLTNSGGAGEPSIDLILLDGPYESIDGSFTSYLPDKTDQDGRFTCISGTCGVNTTDGIVFDHITGLYRQASGYASSNSGSIDTMNRSDGKLFCADLNQGGFDDWRMPDLNELISISDFTKTAPSINTSFFTSSHNDNYWLSISAPSAGTAWLISATFPMTSYTSKTFNKYIRCVRGEKSSIIPWEGTPIGTYDSEHNVGSSYLAESRFSTGGLTGNTTYDNITGLYWQNYKGTNGITYNLGGTGTIDYEEKFRWASDLSYLPPTWDDNTKTYTYPAGRLKEDYPAFEYCEDLDLDGYTDWRLPTITELSSISDHSRFGPAISIDYFNSKSSYYWASTPYIYYGSYGNYAWQLYFHTSYLIRNDKTNESYVRCVH